MNKEQLLAMGLTEEQADKIIADAQAAIEAKQAEIDAIKANKDTILNEKRTLKEKLDAIEAEKSQKLEDDAKTKGDVNVLEKQYQAKEAQYQAKLQALENELKSRDELEARNQVNSTAAKLASALTDDTNNADILADYLSKRLKFDNGTVKVLNSEGEISINSLEELKNEFIACGKYNSLIRGTKASGAGASGTKANKAATELTEAERLELLKNNPERFKQLFRNK